MLKFFELEIDRHRVFGLDILRALAILFVVFAHGFEILRYPLFRYFFVDGVGIFFVLSGFLIGGILIKTLETNKNLSYAQLLNFWKRRWYRTLPNYFFVLILAAFFTIILGDQFTPGGVVHFLANIKRYYIFLQNFATPPPTFFRESWSLSVEEWFYLLIPASVFMLAMTKKVSPRYALLTVCGIVAFMAVGLRWRQFLNMEVTEMNYSLLIHWQVIRRLDSIVLGVLGAYVYHYHSAFWIRFKNIGLAIGVIVLLIYQWVYVLSDAPPLDFFYCVFSTLLFGFSILLMIPFFSQIKSGSGFLFKFITYTSLISYSMYLLNYTIISKSIVQNISLGPGVAAAVMKYGLFWILTFLCSIVLYKYYEKPMMEMRDAKSREKKTSKHPGRIL